MTCSAAPALSVNSKDEPPVAVAIPGSSDVTDGTHTHPQLPDGQRWSSPALAFPDDHNSTPFLKKSFIFFSADDPRPSLA